MSAHPQNGRLRGEWVAKQRNEEQRSYATDAHNACYQAALMRLINDEDPAEVIADLHVQYASIPTQYA